ncbi:MAG: peptide chain release factor N(5)-glutamine methyltransferase [Deltaproteobacteria bacterium]|nr:peptide chain release factor N(5)-glutamine methyltransferase [Deltaproteobacteria bacterium]
MATIGELRRLGRKHLEHLPERLQVSPSNIWRDVDALLAHVLQCSTASLVAWSEKIVDLKHEAEFLRLVSRRELCEPLEYMFGKAEFRSLEFLVNRNVLIPRPETELLVEVALKNFDINTPSFRIIDVGTGSGAIVLSLLWALRERFGDDYLLRGESIAIDICPAALEIAKTNAIALGLDEHVNFIQSDILADVPSNLLERETFLEIILSNPPYVPDNEVLLPDVGEFEPKVALRGGAQGLDVINKLIEELVQRIGKNSIFVLEIGFGQRFAVESSLVRNGLEAFRIHLDFCGIPRAVEVRREFFS